MDSRETMAPILSEQSILVIAGITLVLIITVGVCFTVLLRKDPKAVTYFRGGYALHHVTVLTVVFATILLGLQRILDGEAVAGLLGGIIGYVLGSYVKTPGGKNGEDEE